mgnify:CR=1 FL=1
MKRKGYQIPKTESKVKRHKKNKNEYMSQNHDFKEMDSLLNKMTENNTKTTSFRIFKYYQENNYQDILYDDILSYLSSEYKLNPNNFLNSSDKPFKSLKKFIASLKLTLRNNAFHLIMRKNKKYLILDLPKAIDYLINFNNKNIKIEINDEDSKYENNTSNNSDEILFDVKKIKSNQFNNSDNLIGKKRRRKIIKTEVDPDDNAKEITSIDSNSRNNLSTFDKCKKIKNKNKKENNKKQKKKSVNKNRMNIRGDSPDHNGNKNTKIKASSENNKIYLEGVPLNANWSSYSFCGNTDSIKILSNTNSSNYLNNLEGLYQNEDKLEILYKNKEEENAYNILKSEISPIINGFNQAKNKIEELGESIYSISKTMNTMDYIFSEYITIKSKLLNDSNTLKINFDSLDNEIKILNLCINAGDIPYKDQLFSMHHIYAKKLLNFCQTIIEENNKKIAKLSDYDFNFSFCKLSVESKFKEILENKTELLSVINIENIINPDIIKYFRNINNESKNNERRNEVNIIYINNIKLKTKYEEYVKKFDVYNKNLDIGKKS